MVLQLVVAGRGALLLGGICTLLRSTIDPHGRQEKQYLRSVMQCSVGGLHSNTVDSFFINVWIWWMPTLEPTVVHRTVPFRSQSRTNPARI
jgi:hypothetical protein